MALSKEDKAKRWRAYYLKNKTALIAKKVVYNAKNRVAINARQYAWRKKNKARYMLTIMRHHYKSKYGLTVEERNTMIAAQDGRCKICGCEFKSARATHTDHCHKTGQLRGMLCSLCNHGLAFYEEHKDRAGEYLRGYNCGTNLDRGFI